MSSMQVSFQRCLQQSGETMDLAVQHKSPSLKMMWALEDSDHMTLSGDFLDLPELEPKMVPMLGLDPEDVPSVKQGPKKRRSLAILRRERVPPAKKLEEKTSGPTHRSNGVDPEQKRLRNEISFVRARMLTEQSSSIKAYTDPTLPLLVKNTKCYLSLITDNREAKGAQPAKADYSAWPQKSNTISACVLAGAAALGLRRRRNRATSAPPVQPRACFNASTSKEKHLINNDLKERAFANERSAMALSQQKLKEAMLVPHAPRKPQSESHRKRPQIRGVHILAIPKSSGLRSCVEDEQE